MSSWPGQQQAGIRIPDHQRAWTRSKTEKSKSSARRSMRSKRAAQIPLAFWVEVAGREMQTDFEPILERQIHDFINCANGIFHMGQRDINWVRISKEAKAEASTSSISAPSSTPSCTVSSARSSTRSRSRSITREKEVKELHRDCPGGLPQRDDRLADMTDESVDTFYSCTLCQSFAPNHVCVITPERSGLCGAYNWLDGKAAHQINPTGANQPVKKAQVDRRSQGAVGGHQRVCLQHLAQDAGGLQRLQHHRLPDDLLRMLRMHLLRPPFLQRHHDRLPRIPRR